MSSITFCPARLSGSAAVPPAKSEAHRALLLAALGRGECRLNGFSAPLCDDTLAMIDGVRALGGEVRLEDGALIVTPAPPPGKPVTDAPAAECHVHACAAALRMLIPAFLTRGQAVRFLMEPALFRRPLDAFEPLVRQAGGRMTRTPAGPDGFAVVEVSGFLPAGRYEVDGSRSSQFASGLLIALAHAITPDGTPAPAALTVTGPIVSRPYLDMTLRLMERFGISFTECEEGVFGLSPACAPAPESVVVSGDWSQAAVLLCVDAMGGGVMLPNLRRDGLAAERELLTNPSATPRTPFVAQQLEGATGPIVAVSDYQTDLMDGIRQFVPNEFATLGADGFGFSDTRAGARRFFKIDAESIVVRTLQMLAKRGEVPADAPAKAFEKYDLNNINAGTSGTAGGDA